ncbi:hypothetical protein HK405_008061 [Cladochytrium tenue]|nr:hypothetical protein HK405_008061 [Cladochytrium tenue]
MLAAAALTVLLAVAGTTAAPHPHARRDSTSVSYDLTYDNAGLSLNSVSCSDGVNGLVSKYPTLGDVPGYPAASPYVSWNSPNCGLCYELQYGGNTIYITAVDSSSGGFVIGENAMNALTGGQAVDLGRVEATLTPADASACLAQSK